MLATMESVQLLDEAELLGALVVQSEIAEDYRRTLDTLRKDKSAQKVIARFVEIKNLYEDVQRFGKYHPQYKEITKAMRDAKRELDLHDAVSAFKKAEKELQNLLDEISVELGTAVSQNIKVPTGNPFFDSGSSCGGGCGSGGSCGCKAS
ncbi:MULTISPECIES: YlbF family regulator [Metabacillus]|uniref:Regulator n=1 Tax=Metabacillus indicus TaxID=246786 RepID=A0A084H3G0_METID|nr:MULTISPECIES: YlbF family regulator [Metabacillus]KEZ49965.1 regulator [Metabacillus indicus LMG 22858]KEZ54122.1 regulator [Metabacillus indicus]